ncbi:hypothetical protein GCM10020000_33930 [Streptomyces olivoverticillatus]
MHHLAAPLRALLQQPPVGAQAADDVLRQLGAVDADDRSAAGADLLAQRRHPLLDVRLVRALAQEVGVRAEAVDAQPRGAPLETHGRGGAALADDLRPREHVLAAGGERLRPALGQEARPVAAEDAAQHLPGHVVRQQPVVVRRGPGGV